ncbi:MAG TPA: hypothetical protein GX525_10105 [Bacilli bacterium]|nr:hypothetical protein [Bacilli bacterium]
MDIVVTEQAKEWVAKKGGVVTVQLFTPLVQCCVGQALEVEFLYESPEQPERFFQKVDGETRFFVEKTIPLKNNTVTIDCSGVGFLRTLHASGISRFS